MKICMTLGIKAGKVSALFIGPDAEAALQNYHDAQDSGKFDEVRLYKRPPFSKRWKPRIEPAPPKPKPAKKGK